MNLPIRVRLTMWYAGLLAAIVTSLGTFLVIQLRSDLRQAMDAEAQATSVSIIHAFQSESTDTDAGEPPNLVEDAEDFVDVARASLPPSGGAQLLDDRGQVLAAFGAAVGTRPLATRQAQTFALTGRSGSYGAPLGAEGQDYQIRVTTFRDQDRARVLVLALSMRPIEDAVQRVLVLLLIAGPVALAATALAAYWLARKALRPVELMTSDAQEIGTGRLNERIALPNSHDEVRRLAVTLNAMLERIERGVMYKHRLIADASHELRTPLAVIRAEFDVSLRGDALPPAAREVLESGREEVDRLSRTVDNLLVLAAADEGKLELLTARINLLQAVDDAARPLKQLAAAKGVSLLIDGDAPQVQADPQRLHLALVNLIENAIKFTPPGGGVRATCWQRAGEVGVTVADEGPGISDQDREHLFDRYYRVDSACTHSLGGSGLGLAISRDIALAHGGLLSVDSELGVGSSFSLTLPSWRMLPIEGDESTSASAMSPNGHMAPIETAGHATATAPECSPSRHRMC